MATNQFVPHATGSGANVRDFPTWLASAVRLTGFQAGRASSADANTPLRQATSIAAMTAQWAADRSGLDMLDNGNIATLEAAFAVANRAQSDNFFSGSEVGGTANAIVLTLSPQPASWATLIGVPLRILIPATSTSSVITIGVAGLTGTQPLLLNTGAQPNVGALKSGSIVEVMSDGTQFRMLSGVTPGGFVGVQAFTTAGTFTFTPAVGVTFVEVDVLGGGGAGAGAAASSNSNYVSTGSGGNAGSYGKGVYAVSGPVTVIVGAGGVGAAGAAGSNGGASSFGAFLTAPGGLAGQFGGPTSPPFGTGGLQQSAASGGTILNAPGQPGGLSLGIIAANGGFGGPGGVGPFGGGAAWVNSNVNGIPATGPGCGGGGTCVTGVNGALTGGNGTAGLVVVRQFVG